MNKNCLVILGVCISALSWAAKPVPHAKPAAAPIAAVTPVPDLGPVIAEFGSKATQKIKDVELSESVKLGSANLKRATQGLRQKKVVLAWFSVYIAQFFTNSTADFSSVGNLKAALAKGTPTVVAMTFLRDVGIDKIVDGFKDVLKENKSDISQKPFSDFIDAVKKSGDVKDKQTYFFTFSQNGEKESVSFQTNGKEMFSVKEGAPGTISSFFNLWLGKPVDSGLEQLQEQVLKP